MMCRLATVVSVLTAIGGLELVSAANNERVLGVYLYHRHGDRTAKSWAPVNLTALGADEVHSSGAYYRSRYLADDGAAKISGISSGTAVLSQLGISAPNDAVLYNSAMSFVQGFYPPTGNSESLANGTSVEAPLGGYQYIPIGSSSGAATSQNAESSEWLQGSSGCNNAVTSSNGYFASPEYKSTYSETTKFYQSLLPVIQGTFASSAANFKNGYTIFDLINVATIHNKTIPSSDLLTNQTLSQLGSLASIHEWNLAYNASEPVRAIAGAVLAGQILNSLQAVANGTAGAPKFNIQFGAYGTFMSFFGLAQLPKASNDFEGITNYASSMAFEMYTTSSAAHPSEDEISVRFLYSNGTASDTGLKSFPLFGQQSTSLSWSAFKTGMAKFSITDTQHWCSMCGSTSGQCAANATASGESPTTTNSNDNGNGNGISKPVAGVIGALVTLGVILGLELLAMLVFRLRLVRKSSKATSPPSPGEEATAKVA